MGLDIVDFRQKTGKPTTNTLATCTGTTDRAIDAIPIDGNCIDRRSDGIFLLEIFS